MAHVRGDYVAAIAFFTRARDASVKRAEEKKQDPDWLITYSLACSLCKADRYNEAVTELQKVVKKTERIDEFGDHDKIDLKADARGDSDFEDLRRTDSKAGRRFRSLVGLV